MSLFVHRSVTTKSPNGAAICGSVTIDLDALDKFRDYRRSVGPLPTPTD